MTLKMNAAIFGITLFTILRQVVGQDANCPLSLWVFPALDNCRNGIEPAGIGTLYADGKCNTLDRDSSSNSTQSLFPGNYIAECTSDGNIRFLSSGCLSDTCSTSSLIEGATCDSDSSSTASLYSISAFSNGWPVQDPGLAFLGSDYTCYEFQDDAKSRYVSLVVFGDCSRNAGCQVEGQAVPTASTTKPSTATPVAAPAPVQVPVPLPSPIESPTTTNNTNTTTNSFAPSASPSRFPVPAPTSVPSKRPIMAQIPVSQNNTNTGDDDEILPPFRNSTIQGTATITANQTLELPPPAAGIEEIIKTFPNNGGLKVNPSDGSITYTPNVNFIGTDTFTIQQCRNLPVDSSDVEEDCESLTVAVEVTPLSLTPDADGNDENGTETSSSSNGLYGLAALAIIPIALMIYLYRNKRVHSGSAHMIKNNIYDSENLNSVVNTPRELHMDGDTIFSGLGSSDGAPTISSVNVGSSTVNVGPHSVRLSVTNPPRVYDHHDLNNDETNSSSNHSVASHPQQHMTNSSETSSKERYAFDGGSGPLHPLAAHLMEVRSRRADTASASSRANDLPPTSVIAEPMAQPIPDPYQVQLKDQVRDVLPSQRRVEPILVNAILISENDDVRDGKPSPSTTYARQEL